MTSIIVSAEVDDVLARGNINRHAMLIALKIVSIILLALVTLLVWIIFTPLRLVIDTRRGRYVLSQRGTITMRYQAGKLQPFRVKVFGIPIPHRAPDISEKRDVQKKENSESRSRRKSREAWIKLFKGLSQSLHVNTFRLDLDTDDVVLNAQLVPLTLMMSSGPVNISTNYEGRCYLHLEAECRIRRLIWPFIQFLTTK